MWQTFWLLNGLLWWPSTPLHATELMPEFYRVATFNASLTRDHAGKMVTELADPQHPQIRNVAEIIQRVRPDLLVLQEFDYEPDSPAADLFRTNFLQIPQNGAAAIDYPYAVMIPSNTGIPSGLDLDRDGRTNGPADALGFGFFPGQFAFAVFSRWPLKGDDLRSFQHFLWRDLPDARLPVHEDGSPYYDDAILEILPLSSKNHIDLPVLLPNGKTLHLLVSHPTPPVFDGPEDRNGRRNYDEIRFFAEYLSPESHDYFVDDQGRRGGFYGEHFVILGDMNADPFDGDSTDRAIWQLIDHARIHRDVALGPLTPSSAGGTQYSEWVSLKNDTHLGDPAHDTAAFSSFRNGPGALRVDYVLPDAQLTVVGSGVFWPQKDDPLNRLVVEQRVDADGNPIYNHTAASSDHRLVWVDLAF